MLQTQLTAARVLASVMTGRNLNETLDGAMAGNPALTPQQRAATREACYDVLRHYGLLRAELRSLVKTPPKEEIEALLLVALAQLQFGRAKPYAIVDHAVRCAEPLGAPQTKGLINAVLRNFQRKQNDLPEAMRELNQEARHNLPMWWLKRIQAEYPQHWESMAASAMLHPPLTLRVNTRKTDVATQRAALEAAGLTVTQLGDTALRVDPPRPVSEIPGFSEGLLSVQDASAQYSAPFLDAQNGMRVLDACAAPGGKTGHLLERNDLDLTALDNDVRRVARIESNLSRLGLAARVMTADAADPAAWWDGKPFDRILLDAPCSGSGVIRRHPDIKWLRRQADLDRFAEQQSMLLSSLWNCLASGGRLLYVTCSVFRAENAGVVESFVAAGQDATRDAAESAVRRLPLPAITAQHAMPNIQDGQLLPDAHHDGFFYALLEKR